MTRRTCPTPSKEQHPSKGRALTAMRHRRGPDGRCRGRVYRCPCGFWHLTRGWDRFIGVAS